MVKIILQDELLNKESPNFNSTLYEAEDLSVLRGAVKDPQGDVIEYTGIAPDKLSLNFAKFLSSLGAQIYQYPLWIEIDTTDDDVPVGVFGRAYIDEDEDEAIHTWATWKKSNHTFMQLGERLFIGSNAHTDESLDLSQLTGVLDSVVDTQTIKDLQSELVIEE